MFIGIIIFKLTVLNLLCNITISASAL